MLPSIISELLYIGQAFFHIVILYDSTFKVKPHVRRAYIELPRVAGQARNSRKLY